MSLQNEKTHQVPSTVVKNKPTSRNMHVKKRSYTLPKGKTGFLLTLNAQVRRPWNTAFKAINKNPFNLEFYTQLYNQIKRVKQ